MSQRQIIITDLNRELVSLPSIPFLSKDASIYKWSPNARPLKELSRHIVAKNTAPGKKNLLVMPGTTGRDIQILKYYGVPAATCQWTLVERDFGYIQQFKKNAHQMGLFSTKEVLNYQQCNFNRIEVQKPYDFAWFDLLGNLTYSDTFWLKNKFQITSQSDIFFTFNHRGRSPLDSLFNVIKRTMRDATLRRELDLDKILDERPRLVRSNPVVSRSPSMDYTILLHWILLQYVFAGYSFDCHCYVYSDEDEMLLYHLANFQETEESFAGDKPINTLLEIVDLWRSSNDDSEIAEQVGLEPNLIQRWREVVGLPAYKEVVAYKTAEDFMSLLQDTTVTPPSIKKGIVMLAHQLNLFNPKIRERKEVSIKIEKDSLHLKTPRGLYTIKLSVNFEVSPLGTEKHRIIAVDPLFSHPHNAEALHGIFRLLFVGDEYLHPQLCQYLEKGCFILSRPQELALQSWSYSFSSHERAGAIALPTGMGKTVVAARISDVWYDCAKTKKTILFLAHQREILDQSIKTFLRHTRYTLDDFGVLYDPLDPDLQMLARRRKPQLQSKIVFATIQTLSEYELTSLPKNFFSLIIVDEFHHYKAPTWLPVIEHFKTLYLLGLSATPFRGDIQDPMEVFEKNYLYRMDLARAIWGGYLTMPTWEIFDDKTNYSQLIRETGLSKKRIKSIYGKERVAAILDVFHEKARNKKTIAFCNSVEHAKQMRDAFLNPKKVGSKLSPITAEVLTSDSTHSQRKEAIQNFSRGNTTVLCVVGLFDEGIDVPDVEALLILRSTRSPVKMFQQLGRGLRLSPGKREVLILDFVSNYAGRNAVFNLAQFSQVGSSKIYGVSGISETSDDLPNIPPFKVNFGPGVKFIIRNLVDAQLKELDARNREKARKLRSQSNLFAHEIASRLKAPYSKVLSWLSKLPLKQSKQLLISSIRDLLQTGLTDEEIKLALADHLEGYSYEDLRQHI